MWTSSGPLALNLPDRGTSWRSQIWWLAVRTSARTTSQKAACGEFQVDVTCPNSDLQPVKAILDST